VKGKKIMEEKELRERVFSFPYWYHRIELPFGIITPGWAPVSKELYNIPEDLSGKRVLDVGAWDGFWTFEALKRGAVQVVAIDDFSDFMGHLENTSRKAWATFDLCKEALGYSDEQCRRLEMSVYDISPEQLGMFDLVFFFGVLYHLRHPLLAIDKLATVCRREMYIETAILDRYSPYRGGFGKGYPDGQMVMEFYPGRQYANNYTNWWVPTLECLGQMVGSAGFSGVEVWEMTDQAPADINYCRGFARGVK
jgi:tRNA (mo5U34)-methyltransferase